ncbi:MAG TPA: transporter substrate-binding domain-containing protein, partial [Novosphingobium sp.]|nr:transporter substrate-binding domain-containing protein [Novosphingobium sp.]
DNRPWSWADGAGLHGIDVDLGKALAAQLGVAAEVVDFMPGDDLAADLRNTVWRGGLLGFQPCDVMLHVPFDHELQLANDQVAILAPYCREGFAMLCGSDVDCEAPPPHFRGLRLAAETASASDAYLLGAFGGVLRGDVHHFRNGYDAAAAVGSGQADMAMATAAQVEAASHDATASLHRRRGPLPAMSSPGWDVAMAVKENSRTLGDALENIIGKMVANGQMAALFAAHGVSWKAALAG